jgi:hypothetical protein
MAAWLIPALKAVLPHVGTIISVAAPVFTKKTPAVGDPAAVQQQIAELQTAAAGNAAHIRELAEQLKTTVEALEQAAEKANRRLRWMLALGVGAVVLSVLTLGIVLWSLLPT